jgi:RNA polymerase sigma factor (TIGR02999 family)
VTPSSRDSSGQAPTGEVTRLLRAARDGDGAAMERALGLVYDDLRVLARQKLAKEYQERTLEPTGLVHEAYLKLTGGAIDAKDRSHFFALAANAMRQVLVDHARKRLAGKREDAWKQVTLTGLRQSGGIDAEELIALDDALSRLDERQRKIVECRFFAGMEETEIAAALGVTDRTVRREWAKARAHLNRALYGSEL